MPSSLRQEIVQHYLWVLKPFIRWGQFHQHNFWIRSSVNGLNWTTSRRFFASSRSLSFRSNSDSNLQRCGKNHSVPISTEQDKKIQPSQIVPQAIRDLQSRHNEPVGRDIASVSNGCIKLAALKTVDDVLTVGIRHQVHLAEMERLLSHLLKISGKLNQNSMVDDPRFRRFLEVMTNEVKHGSAQTVTKILCQLENVPNCPQKTALISQCTRYAVARPNGFSPATFVECVDSVARLGGADIAFVQFVRDESLHLMAEFGPHELYKLLNALHVMRLYSRQLIDFIVEKMSEEIDRFTPMDIVQSLDTIATMGLVRVHITQQLASLALKNMDQLTSSELTSIASSLGRLRFIKADDFMAVLEVAARSMETRGIHQLCFTSTLVKGVVANEHLKTLIRRILPRDEPLQLENTVPALAAIYAIMAFQLTEFYPQLESVFQALTKEIKISHRTVTPLLSEALTSMKIEHSSVTLNVPTALISQIKEQEKLETVRWENSRPLAEVQVALSHLAGKYKLDWERGSLVESCYYSQFLNSKHKIVLELEAPQDITGHMLRHRHLSKLGYRTISISFWKWKTYKTEDQQMEGLQELLTPHLMDIGLIHGNKDLKGTFKQERGVRYTATLVAKKLKEISK